ncbi:hypothetical protein H4R18_003633 [Coemansia javaensis]|uniref:HhH-GPD domain-containing protein n=1 Tax=Coemansia javaensis TaxID=2761396 RepID=A0A9W8H9V8_9FUNG|nr:hypothetical protein H4R18_003633 [Coemansia javaensis]
MTTRRSARLVTKAAAAKTKDRVAKPAPKKRADKKRADKDQLPIVVIAKPPPATMAVASPLAAVAATVSLAAVARSLADPGTMDAAVRHLRAADAKLAELIDRTTEVCSMSLPRDRDDDSCFTSLCRSVIYQQLAGKAAQAILLRFLKRYGTLVDAAKAPLLLLDGAEGPSALSCDDFRFPGPQAVAALDVDEVRAVGLGQRKAEYIRAVAERFNDGTLSDERLASMGDDEASRALVAIRGIGQWTADMFLMFHLKRPNVLPTLDLAVRKAMCSHFGVPFGKNSPTHEQMVELARPWEPYRSVATWYMWRLANTITQKS